MFLPLAIQPAVESRQSKNKLVVFVIFLVAICTKRA